MYVINSRKLFHFYCFKALLQLEQEERTKISSGLYSYKIKSIIRILNVDFLPCLDVRGKENDIIEQVVIVINHHLID